MASCYICHKKTQSGYRVSHSAIKTKREFKPNLHKLRAKMPNGAVKLVAICSKCYKRVKKDIKDNKMPALMPISLINQDKYNKPQKGGSQ